MWVEARQVELNHAGFADPGFAEVLTPSEDICQCETCSLAWAVQ